MVLYQRPQQHKLGAAYEVRKVNLPPRNLNIDAVGVYSRQIDREFRERKRYVKKKSNERVIVLIISL